MHFITLATTSLGHLRITTRPVIVGAHVMIEKGTDKYVDKIPGHASQYEIQKIAVYGITHLPRTELSMRIKK